MNGSPADVQIRPDVLVAGGFGLTNLSAFARRISMALFAIFFLGFLALLGFAYLLGEAFETGQHSMLVIAIALQA